jgi:hypothetical protein
VKSHNPSEMLAVDEFKRAVKIAIYAEMQRIKISRKTLAKLADCDIETVHLFFSDEAPNMNAVIIAVFADALGMEASLTLKEKVDANPS